MKIAVIDHVGNHGGGSRVVRLLLPALMKLDPELEMTYYGNPAAIRREGIESEFAAAGIRVLALDSLRLRNSPILGSGYLKRAIELIQTQLFSKFPWLPVRLSGNVTREISCRVKGYDIAFYPWPFLLKFPELSCPSVGLFHDFNYKYYFGGSFVFSPSQRAQLEEEMPAWLERSIPVVSTKFMATELQSFYPTVTRPPHVVHLAPLSVNQVDRTQAREAVRQFGITTQYLLYPTHLCSHKNIGPLIAAFALLRQQGRELALVLTGAGTDEVRGYANAFGVRLDKQCGEVRGLGYVTNHQMDCLIQCAAVMVSSSLYEAGNGPGLDGWGRGIPVAMSNIPAFLEHIHVSGVKAKVFDPRSPEDIADKIASILDNPERARADAASSLEALGRLTWEQTAEAYLKVFKNAVHHTAG
ncbi:MAG: glycosyltransferase [Burkholderiales bacterium]|nr:glycosyltransferase [Burkholderiales bacterium]